MTGDGALVLVRHTQVCSTWKGYCYGASDVALSPDGRAQIAILSAKLADLNPAYVCHSGRTRTEALAAAVAERSGARLICEERFGELNFGDWEGRAWDDIYAEAGDRMADMIHAPASFAPPGGETVAALRQRVIRAIGALPKTGLGIVVSHGGPLSAIRGTLAGRPASAWPKGGCPSMVNVSRSSGSSDPSIAKLRKFPRRLASE